MQDRPHAQLHPNGAVSGAQSLALAVDVQGSLVRTNAEHVNGSRVTLLDVDFGRLMENPAVFEKLTAVRPGASLSDVKPLLKELPGVMINSSSSIMIVLK